LRRVLGAGFDGGVVNFNLWAVKGSRRGAKDAKAPCQLQFMGRAGMACDTLRRIGTGGKRLAIPSEAEVHAEVPEADDQDGNQISGVNVYMERAGLQVEQQNAEDDTGEADEVEPAKTPGTPALGAIRNGQVAKGPQLVPSEVAEDGDFSGDGFAQ
jgi:hypothetical protein